MEILVILFLYKLYAHINIFKFYFLCLKMEFQNITNFLDITSGDNNLPTFVTKNGLKFMVNQEEITMLIKKLELKHQC